MQSYRPYKINTIICTAITDGCVGLMDYKSLENFIHKDMRMTHVYQPLMLKAVLESKDGKVTVEDIARSFVDKDLSYLEYYKKIVKRWPHMTLVKSRKVLNYDKKDMSYSLRIDEDLSQDQKDKLVELCDLRLHQFTDNDERWILHRRIIEERHSLGSIKYDILAKSKGVCVACGAKSTEALLHVDHIIPIARGGQNTPENMQVLCGKCNTEKRDRDDTDFLLWHNQLKYAKNPKCRFCNRRHDSFLDNRMAYAICQSKSEHIYFVVPTRHVGSFVDLIPAEKQLCLMLIDKTMEQMREDRPNIQFDVSGLDSSGRDHCSIRVARQ